MLPQLRSGLPRLPALPHSQHCQLQVLPRHRLFLLPPEALLLLSSPRQALPLVHFFAPRSGHAFVLARPSAESVRQAAILDQMLTAEAQQGYFQVLLDSLSPLLTLPRHQAEPV